MRELYRRTGGVPRLLNVLADRSLLAGYASGSKTVGGRTVREAAREILHKQTEASPRRRRFLRGALAVGLLLTVVAVIARIAPGASRTTETPPSLPPVAADAQPESEAGDAAPSQRWQPL